MVKKTPKMFFRYKGEDMSLISIFNKNKKRPRRSRYLLSVMVGIVKDGKVIPAKVVYVRNRNKRNEYLCIISMDTELDKNENEIIRIYGKRWKLKSFSKFAKVICIWAKNADPSPMMQWRLIPQLFLPDIWCYPSKAVNQTTNGHLVNCFILFRWNVWHNMDPGFSITAWDIPRTACR